MFRIRPFERTEIENKAVAEIQSVAWSNCLNSVAMWNRTDSLRDPRSLVQRFVAVDQGDIVGLAVLMEPEHTIAQGKYGFSIAVRPDQQGKGIGGAIYRRMMSVLEGRPVLSLVTGTSENNHNAIRFLQRYGFRQSMRDPIASLDLADFDATPFAGIWERMARQGIQVLPLTRAALRFPDWQRRIWELDWELKQDLRSIVKMARSPFEQYQRSVLGRSYFNPASWFVALDGEKWVGICRLMDLKVPVGHPVSRVDRCGAQSSPARYCHSVEDQHDRICLAVRRAIHRNRDGREQPHPRAQFETWV